MKYQITQYSLRGARPLNEDRVGYAERDNAVLMAVADGLGGHRGGEVAAEILVQTLMHSFQSLRQPVIQRPSAFLALGILQAHHAIIRRGQASQTPIEPRTTCVTCLVQNGYAYWAHLGGGVTPTISVGEETLLQPGDMLLACTDGLWEAFAPEEIARYLKAPALDEGMEEMLHAAVRKMKHGCDNVSAVCLRWEDAMSKSAPLQGNTAVQIDEAMLRQEARHHLPHVVRQPTRKPAAPSVEAGDDRDKPLQDRI